MSRAVLLSMLLLLVAVPAAGAEIRVIDTTTGASRTLLKREAEIGGSSLVRWTDDGAALVANPRGSVLRLGVADGSVTHLFDLDEAESVGPGLRYLERVYDSRRGETYALRRADGGRIGVYRFAESDDDVAIAWSPDGARVAIGLAPRLKVIDTATGAVLLDTKVPDYLELGAQAFAPDGSALLAGDALRVHRIDIPSGAASTVLEDDDGDIGAGAEWSRTGGIAVNLFAGIRVVGGDEIRAPTRSFEVPAIWTPAGDALTLAYSGPEDDCSFPSQGVATLVPGGARRVVLPARNRKVLAYAWSPDGSHLAVELAKVRPPRSKPRGKRHPWPRTVARDYALGRRANRAFRRIVLRAARALRRGAGRERTLRDLRVAVARRDPGDSAVLEAIADGIDPWLHAAGFERIEALDEIECL
jgi:hypothetical protein